MQRIIDNVPSINDVNIAWNIIVEEERSDLLKDFSSLSENQKKMMISISNYGGKSIYSNGASKKSNINTTSIAKVITFLMENDYIEKIENEYKIIIPVYKPLLRLQP